MNDELTPKEQLTERVVLAPEFVTATYKGVTFTIHKLSWKRFDTLFNTFRSFVAGLAVDMISGGSDVGSIDIMKAIETFPTSLLGDLVRYTTELDVDSESTSADLIFFLAGKSIVFNFSDNEGVRAFFIEIAGMVKPTPLSPSIAQKSGGGTKAPLQKRRKKNREK